jgi:autotransporter translocation and assembly factor TamB
MAIVRRLAGYLGIAALTALFLIAVGLVATQTGFFRNYLRGLIVKQAAQYLNGTLTIQQLRGSVLTGVELDGVTLQHEGQTAVAMNRLALSYDPITLIKQGLILRNLTLDDPTVLLQRDNAGWNFSRFVKTRKNTNGKGAPPLTIETLNVNNGHVIVRDQGRLLEDVTSLNTKLRFAYHKPGVEFDITQLSGRSPDVNIHKLAGNLRFDEGATHVGDLGVETDRSNFVTTFAWAGGSEPLAGRKFDVTLHATRLSLPEVGRFFKPLAGINIEPAVDVTAHGTFAALAMEVNVVSSEGNAHGPLVGHFGANPSGLEGTLDVQHVDLQHIVNRPEWKTRVTGRAQFDWKFGHPTAVGTGAPMKVNFKFAGPEVQGFGYRAENVQSQGIYTAPDLKFDASGAAYGASATTRASFHFPAAGPMSYTLAGNFRNLDMRRLPPSLAMPKLDTVAAGEYQFASNGHDWRGNGTLAPSVAEGARFGSGTVFEIDSHDRALHYSATGTVAGLDPQRFAFPFNISWLADDRFRGLLTGNFTFDGSGRTVDSLVLSTTADLTDSTLAGAHFPQAHATMQLSNRQLSSTFAGAFERLPGTLLTTRRELADSMLNGSADMGVTITIPADGPVVLSSLNGAATLAPSTIAGVEIDKGQASGTYANDILNLSELNLTGPRVVANAKGTLAMGTAGQSNLTYDVALTDLTQLGERLGQPLGGSAHVIGRAAGPASQTTFSGSIDANRFTYSTTVNALTASSKYTVMLADFDVTKARIQADTQGSFVTMGGINFPRVSAQTTYQSQQLDFNSLFEEETRTLGLGGSLLFHPDHKEVHLRALNLTVGQVQWGLPAGREATAHYTADSITIDNLTLQRGAQSISADGIVAIGAASSRLPNNLNVRFDNVQVQDINQLLLGQRPLSGLLNATAQIRGTRSDPQVAADFSVTGGVVQGVNFESLSGKANYEGKAVNLDARLQQNPSAVLTAVGLMPLPNGPGDRARADTFDLNVKSTPIDLALFQAATTQVTTLSGQLQTDMHIGGRIESPQLNGQLNVTNAGFAVPSTGVTYRNALARLTFEGDRVVVDRFQISDNANSQLVAIGQLGFVSYSLGPMNVQLSAQNFKVLDNQYGQIIVDSDLRISGDATKPQITGTISPQTGRLEVDQLLEELTKNPYSTAPTIATTMEAPATTAPAAAPALIASTKTSSPASTPSLYDAATVDVTVNLPDDFMLRGRDMQTAYSRIGLGNMNITVGGDLHIRKDPAADPDIVGTVSVVRGFYEFQNRRFDVLRDSQIRFQGLKPIDPALQVGAERIISGVTAVVNIRGTARQPVVSLTSQPPMDEADVLSLIVFNQPINQLGSAERLNLVQRAGSMAAGYIATPLANSIADALDLDVFEIRPEGGINGQPSVALGQQIGSRLFVQFQQDFGSADHSQISFEYRISEILRLVSTFAQGAQQVHGVQRIDTTGTDLIFVLSY